MAALDEQETVKRPPDALLGEFKTSLDRVFYAALDAIELVVPSETFEKVRRRILREGNREFRRVASLLQTDFQVGYAHRVEIVFDPPSEDEGNPQDRV